MKRPILTWLLAALFWYGANDWSAENFFAQSLAAPFAQVERGLTTFATDGYPRQPHVDVLHYDLALQLSDTSNVFWGEAQLNIKIRATASAKSLRLDLREMAVTSVSVAQQNAAFEYEQGVITIPLPPHLQSDDTLSVTIAYHGEPKDGLIISNNKFGQRTIFADNWPNRASYWFPSLDHPSDKSTVAFQVTLPAHYTVIANGRLRNVRGAAHNNKTWEWSERVPIPTYCMVFGAANFSVLPIDTNAALPISYYIYPEDASYARQNFGRVHEMVQFFTSRFGAYPFEKLALVQSSTRYGGMENASAIFFAENSLGKEQNLESTTAHEIAHQWFGNSATEADWHHLWLSEGFATYGEALFFEHVDGVALFRENMKAKRENYFNFAQQARGPILDHSITEYMALLSPNNYAKAGWVLHMLRNLIGDEAFGRGVRNYYTRYQKSNALTQDFRVVMEEASGVSLEWFFRQWLEQPDYPQVQARWRWRPAQKQIELVLRQTQTPALYRLPIDLAFAVGAAHEKHQVEMNEREQRFFLQTSREPEYVVFDPEVKSLLAVEVIKLDNSD